MPALVVPLQTQPRSSPLNWCTIFPSRRCSLSYSLMPTLLESTLALMVLRCIWLCAVVWPALLPWNPSCMLIPKTLRQLSCVYSYAMGSATPLFLTRTENSTASAEKHSTFCKSIVMFFQGTTTTRWWLSASIGTWPKGLKIMTNKCDSIRVALKAILLLLYACNSCPIPGMDISRSLVAVGRELPSPSTILQINIGSSRPPHPV